jgi:thiol-disulfide isomerase/thioredoxin
MSRIKTQLKDCAVRRPKLQSFKHKTLLVGVSVCIAGLLLVAGNSVLAQDLGHQLARLKTPVEAPGFQLKDMDQTQHSLRDYRGKVVMLNFWATWCPPCRQEMPSLEAVYQDLKEDGFVVVAVNQWESPDQVFPYLGQLDVFPTFPILFDHKGSVSKAYDVKGLPTTVVIDKKGNVVFRAIGGRDFNHPEVKKLIRELL